MCIETENNIYYYDRAVGVPIRAHHQSAAGILQLCRHPPYPAVGRGGEEERGGEGERSESVYM